MRNLLRPVSSPGLWLAAFLTALASAAGLLVFIDPFWELANHFRPYVLVAALLLLLLALAFSRKPVAIFALALTLANGLLLAPALFNQAEAARKVGKRTSFLPDPNAYRVMSFNMWVRNGRTAPIEEALRRNRPDFVLFQEFTASHHQALSDRLKDLYPHQYSCAHDRSCQLALYTRHPITEVRHIRRDHDNPPLIDATFDLPGAGGFRLLGVHLAWPFQPDFQRRHVDWLAKYAQRIKEPLILGGDLNLTPWAWKMGLLQSRTGLRRHTTFMHSWPAHRLAPFVQLDHVLSSPHFKTVSARTGKRLGSDHLPVIVDLRLERAPRVN